MSFMTDTLAWRLMKLFWLRTTPFGLTIVPLEWPRYRTGSQQSSWASPAKGYLPCPGQLSSNCSTRDFLGAPLYWTIFLSAGKSSLNCQTLSSCFWSSMARMEQLLCSRMYLRCANCKCYGRLVVFTNLNPPVCIPAVRRTKIELKSKDAYPVKTIKDRP